MQNNEISKKDADIAWWAIVGVILYIAFEICWCILKLRGIWLFVEEKNTLGFVAGLFFPSVFVFKGIIGKK
jgi:hypothetical protein